MNTSRCHDEMLKSSNALHAARACHAPMNLKVHVDIPCTMQDPFMIQSLEAGAIINQFFNRQAKATGSQATKEPMDRPGNSMHEVESDTHEIAAGILISVEEKLPPSGIASLGWPHDDSPLGAAFLMAGTREGSLLGLPFPGAGPGCASRPDVLAVGGCSCCALLSSTMSAPSLCRKAAFSAPRATAMTLAPITLAI